MQPLLLEIPNRIETDRLYLRPYQAGDGSLIYAVGKRNREHLAQYESGNFLNHLRDEQHAEIVVRELALDWMARKHFFMGVFHHPTHQWVGQVYLGPTHWEIPEFAIGYVADVEHQGKGFITEAVKAALCFAFENLQAHRVRSDCHETNQRSYRVLERCGFTREGHFRENKKNPDGSFHGDYQYGLLRREFESINCA